VSDGPDGALGNVKEAFQGKRGKILLIGGAAVVGYLYFTRGRGGTPETVEEDIAVPNPGRVPQSEPGDFAGGTGGGAAPSGRPTTNEAWLTQGVDVLVGRGSPSGSAYSALRKALDGAQITSQEAAWINQVISALGSPPEGMPPLNIAPPTTPGGGGGTPTPPKALPGPAKLRASATTSTVTLRWSKPPSSPATIVHGPNGVKHTIPAPLTVTVFTGLKKGTRYGFQAQSVWVQGLSPKTGMFYISTKK